MINPTPFVIAIAGPSGSGKSSFAKLLMETINPEICQQFALDHYYRDLRHLSPEERSVRDFDHPDAWESELILKHISLLKQGNSVEIPQYDFDSHLRRDSVLKINPTPLIIVEGLFALCYPALNPLIDLSIFIDIDDSTALARRLRRDIAERGRTDSGIRSQFENTVLPACHKHIRPSSCAANLKFSGDTSLPENVEIAWREIQQHTQNYP